ncbi:MAG: flavodoxin reductase [Aequorivita sp.]
MNGTWRDEHHIKILETEYLTPNVKRFRTTKPEGYQFIPGEATDIVIYQPEWLNKRRAFTFTGLNEWPFLEFTIKIYKDHQGVTNKLDSLKEGDKLIIHDSFGDILYNKTGTFIAGGAGVTPFIANFRQLAKDGRLAGNRLIYSNQTEKDIILREEFERLLGADFINTLTRDRSKAYHFGRINKGYLKEVISDFSQYFYVCGSVKMMEGIKEILIDLGAEEEKVVIELDFKTQVLD